MPAHLDRIPIFFAKWIAEHGDRGPVGEVAQWLATGELEPLSFAALVAKHGCGREPWFRLGVLDLVLDYARDRLARGGLTVHDVTDVRLLKFALHVADGDFFEHRPSEVSAFLQDTVEAVLTDGVLADIEELYLVEVQAAFDLSYDQYLILARPALERAMSRLRTTGSSNQVDFLAANNGAAAPLSSLESTYRLALRHRRSPGAMY